MATQEESEFEKLGRLIKEEGEDIRDEIRTGVEGLRTEMHEQFTLVHEELAAINRRLDTVIQIQLDEHAHRLKKLEAAVFST